MTNRLTEQQLQEELLDEVGDFSRAILRKAGQGIGGVKGAGQKVKGAVTRGAKSLGQAYTQGRDSAQKAVAGKDYKAPTAKAQAQTQIKKPGFLKRAAGAVSTGIGKADAYAQKALDKVDDVTGYNWQSGLPDRSQQTYTGVGGASIGKNAQSGSLTQRNKAAGMAAKLQKTDAEAQRKAELEKRLGTTGAQASAANQDQKAIQKSIARNKKNRGSISKGISQAQIDAANKGVANLKKNSGPQRDSTGKIVSTGKGPQRDSTGKIVSTGKGPQRDSKGKIVSTTAKDVAQKTKVSTAKIGGQKIDLNDPRMAKLRAQIEKKAQ